MVSVMIKMVSTVVKAISADFDMTEDCSAIIQTNSCPIKISNNVIQCVIGYLKAAVVKMSCIAYQIDQRKDKETLYA